MYTQCPECELLFEVRAANLRTAMGMVRCTSCKTVFNALASLRDEDDVESSAAISVGDQLPLQDMGDKVVVTPEILARMRWFKEALKAGHAPGTLPPPPGSAPPPAAPPSFTEDSGPLRPRVPSQQRQAQRAARAPAVPPVEDDAVEAAAPRGLRANLFSLARRLFGQTLGLALLNLTRHRRRTLLGLAAIAIGVTALVLAGGFAEWMIWAERETTIHSRLGHVQIVRKDYFTKGIADPHAFLIEDGKISLDALEQMNGVATATPRMQFSGLISRGDTTMSFLGDGVVPSKEVELSRDITVFRGEPLRDDDPAGIVLGKGLAANLGAEPGDAVVLLTNSAAGRVSAVEASVSGIFRTVVKAYDDVALRVPIELARDLTRAKGAHNVVLLLDDTRLTAPVTAALRQSIPEERFGFEIVPWSDLAEFYKAVEELFTAQTNFVRAIIGFIIIMTISNTMVMSVIERTSEIGTMMAVGLRRRKIMRLFVSEGFLLGTAGGIVGVILGYAGAYAISRVGIPMPPAPGMDEGFVASVRVTPLLSLSSFLVAVVATVLASLYPAWKAANLNVVDALRRSR
ncbi:MAG: FtsX-like permease family protein [Gammaproteobacteria bacterium]